MLLWISSLAPTFTALELSASLLFFSLSVFLISDPSLNYFTFLRFTVFSFFFFLAVLGLHWASRVAQMVKNPPTMQETWVFTVARGLLSSAVCRLLTAVASPGAEHRF